jgi:hypothetical protein
VPHSAPLRHIEDEEESVSMEVKIINIDDEDDTKNAIMAEVGEVNYSYSQMFDNNLNKTPWTGLPEALKTTLTTLLSYKLDDNYQNIWMEILDMMNEQNRRGELPVDLKATFHKLDNMKSRYPIGPGSNPSMNTQGTHSGWERLHQHRVWLNNWCIASIWHVFNGVLMELVKVVNDTVLFPIVLVDSLAFKLPHAHISTRLVA